MLKNWDKAIGYWRSKIVYQYLPNRRRPMERLYQNFIKPGDLCFDVGSHLGNRINCWRNLEAQVVAFEPQETFYRYLAGHFGEDSQVTIEPLAVSSQEGEMELFISDRYPTVSSLNKSWMELVRTEDERFAKVKWNRSSTVKVVTLDQLIDKYGLPSFCKIDVEGHETEVLRGLSRPIPSLSFEYLPVNLDDVRQSIQVLAKLSEDYRFNCSPRETMKLALQDWVTAEGLLEYLESLEKLVS